MINKQERKKSQKGNFQRSKDRGIQKITKFYTVVPSWISFYKTTRRRPNSKIHHQKKKRHFESRSIS
jgi:hypothetical protein